MSKLDVVTQIANAVFDRLCQGGLPNDPMRLRGFDITKMVKALQVIGVALADSRKTSDGKAYDFEFDAAFAADALNTNQASLDGKIDLNTTSLTQAAIAQARASNNSFLAVKLLPDRRRRAKPIIRS